MFKAVVYWVISSILSAIIIMVLNMNGHDLSNLEAVHIGFSISMIGAIFLL